MAKVFNCDICKKECEEITGKLFYTALVPGRGANNFSNNYSHHLDVGSCCAERLLKGFNWQERLSATEYRAQRRKSKRKRATA